MKKNIETPAVRHGPSRFVGPNPELPTIMRTGQVDRLPEVVKPPAPLRTHVFASIMIVGACVVITFCLYKMGLPWQPMGVGAVIAFLWLSKRTLEILNGDAVQLKRTAAAERVEHNAINSQRKVAERHYDLLELQEENRHVEEVARIQANSELSKVSATVAWLVDEFREVRQSLVGQAQQPPRLTYVPAKDEAAKRAIEAWLMSLWDVDGTPLFVPGQVKMPWNLDGWVGQPWAGEAKQLLLDTGILVEHGTGYRLVPDSVSEAMGKLNETN